MKYSCVTKILLPFLLGVVLTTGCDKSSAPPAPITVEELAPALDKAFGKANAEVKALASQISGDLKSPDYSKAYFGLQALSGKSGLTKEQVSVVARGLLCLNTVLQSAQSNGDKKAAETLRLQRMSK